MSNSILLTVSIACFNQAEITKACLANLRRNTRNLDEVQFIFINNGSKDSTRNLLEAFTAPHKVVINHSYNTGFGPAHNFALTLATGKYFLSLNNDIFLKDPNWLDLSIRALADKKVGLVGLSETPCTLRDDGTGFVGPTFDYVEGSFVMGRTADFRKYGLFSPAIKFFVCEDSDLSLRFRQMGLKLVHLPIRYVHRKNVTLRTIDRAFKDRIVAGNMKVLMARWKRYFKSRKFYNAILVQIPSVGIGDVLCATPVLAGLRRDHPTARIVVETQFPAVFESNPYVAETRYKGDMEQFDRVVRIAPDFKLQTPIYRLCEAQAVTTLESGLPQIYLTKEEINEARETLAPLREWYERVFIFAPLMSRENWQGRNWNIDQARRLVDILQLENIGLVEVGKDIQSTGAASLDLVGKTNLRQLFALTAVVDGFVGIDSLPLHVAQAFRKPIYALFGAVEPVSRIVDFNMVSIIRRHGLPCIGCYQKGPGPGFNQCSRGDEGCMQSITAEMVADAVLNNNGQYSLEYLYRALLERVA